MGSSPLVSLSLGLGSTAWHRDSTDCQNQVEGKDSFPGPAGCSYASTAGSGWPPLLQGHSADPVQLVVQQHPEPFGQRCLSPGTSSSLELSVMADSSFVMTRDSSLRGLQCVPSGPTEQLI